MPCAIAVMAKAPQPGRCKTRLAPLLGAEGAAALSAAFLRDITENLRLAATTEAIAPYVAYAPEGYAHLFDGMLAYGTELILADGSGRALPGVEGFGSCLLHAMDSLFAAGFSAACVLNSDSPTLPTAYLRRAAAVLAMPGDRAVLGPAEDGGYYLLGMKRTHASLFADIDWSTDRVARPNPRPRPCGRDPARGTGRLVRRGRRRRAGPLARRTGRCRRDRIPRTGHIGMPVAVRSPSGVTSRQALAALMLLGACILALTWLALSLHVPGSIWVGTLARKDWVVGLMLASGAAYFAAVALVTHRTLPPRAVIGVLAVAAIVRISLLAAPPFMSTDVYRYVWDGRVQAAGINPLRLCRRRPRLGFFA